MEQQPNQQNAIVQDLLSGIPPMDAGLFYVPSSIQKKRALMMYLLIGIVMVLSEKKTNEFEYFHLKQSIGWWISFLAVLLLALLLLFFPYIKILGILALMAWVAFAVVFIKQTRDGIYKKDLNTYRASIFPSLGNRVVSLFDLSFDEQKDTPVIS